MSENERKDLQDTLKRLQQVKNKTTSSAGLRAVARSIKYIEDQFKNETEIHQNIETRLPADVQVL